MKSLRFPYKKCSRRLRIPSLGLALWLLISFAAPTSSCTEQEEASLLQFLAQLSNDAGLAKSWQGGTDCCKWEGITCNRNRTVVEVSLPSRGLKGRITPSISNLTGLQHLNLSYNLLYGDLPRELLSTSSIIVLDVSFNELSGEPHEQPSSTRGQPLQVLNISSNKFTGQFTSITWKTMENLVALNASNNSFTGQMPTHFCNISPSFAVLDLCYNQFNGTVPPGLGNCSMLRVLKAGHNNLIGTLPDELFNATSLEYLSFPNNNLQGVLHGTQIINARKLSTLDLGGNNFIGDIPNYIGELKGLEELYLDNNNMSGELPSSLGSCTNLTTIDLKNNNFSGELIKILNSSKNLTTLLIGDNFMHETMPDDDGIDGFENLQHSLVMMPGSKGLENKLKFTDIVKATNNFGKENIVGCGGYGLVFKAELPDGSKLAIKKLNGEMCLMEREFTAEVEALSMAQHENLVPLWGYCIHGNSRFLIYSFLENGSLDDWLHNRDDDRGTFLDWPARLKIAQGASRGLSYIHDVCKPHIVHRDIKSSNILLDKEFRAYLADFGLSRLILPNKTHVTTELIGTLGYIPPEYSQGWVATLRGDIYSFGVVLLELLTGRRPAPVLSTSKELVPWVLEMRSQGKPIEVLDPALRCTGQEEQMLKMLEVACRMVSLPPQRQRQTPRKHSLLLLRRASAPSLGVVVVPHCVARVLAEEEGDGGGRQHAGDGERRASEEDRGWAKHGATEESRDGGGGNLRAASCHPDGNTLIFADKPSSSSVIGLFVLGPADTAGRRNARPKQERRTAETLLLLLQDKETRDPPEDPAQAPPIRRPPDARRGLRRRVVRAGGDGAGFHMPGGLPPLWTFAKAMLEELHSSRKKSNGFHIPFLGLALLFCLAAFLPPTSSCSEKEMSSLLQFLAGLSQDGGLGLSWKNSTDCSTWEGVACGTDGTVTDVSVTSKDLEGHISASLGMLSGLLRLNLSHNLLSGGLPLELMSSNSINVLDVSFNRLNGNLHELPSSTPSRPLQVLNISSNLFTGEFPSGTWEVMSSLVSLNASNNSFTGQIPSHLCSSSPVLAVIALCYNQLSGSIPPALGNCSMLKVLKAGHNTLSGPLPDELFNATSLEYLSFPDNGLQGILDGGRLINLRNLVNLDLGGNRLNGKIPDSIGQLKRLEELHLDHNNMSGELPSTLSNCTNLITIDLKGNSFSGELQKGDLGFLIYSYMENGSLDDWLHNSDDHANSFLNWPMRLRIAHGASMGLSYIHGVCKPYIVHRDIKSSNILLDKNFKAYVADFGLSRLVHANKTHVTTELVGTLGYIPPEYGQGWVATLRGDIYSFGIVLLELLTGRRPVLTLSSSKELAKWVQEMKSEGKQIDVLDPALRGTGHEEQMLKLPPEYRMLGGETAAPPSAVTVAGAGQENEQESNSLLQFLAGLSQHSNLSLSWKNGTDCCKWEGINCSPDKTVTGIFLASRSLQGFISPFLGNLTGLLRLNLSYNLLSGGLPLELVLYSSITVLDVSFNQLSGDLQGQPSATPVRPLQVLNISSNLFTGKFPSSTWEAMKNLVALNNSNNNFIGEIPTALCVIAPSLAMLDLSYNRFSGSIPPGLGNCSMMTSLNAGHNNLSGTLPDDLFNITLLEHLSFQNNQLEGSLSSISKLINLVTLDLGGNGFGGNIPDSIGELKRLEEIHLDYNHLSGDLPSTLSDCRNIITIDLKNNNFSGELTKVAPKVFELPVYKDPSLQYRMPNAFPKELNLAINNFTGVIPNEIGCGGYGLVYKAVLPDGCKVAIKKLSSEMCLMDREFSAEVDALSMAQHDNLVPLWGYCIQGDSRFLIYTYMENGSLDDWLHNIDDDVSSFLDWPMRLKIAQGASRGLSYIHDVCKPPIVHRDIKSSNILLDKEFKAYVADFGLSRLVLPNKTHVTTELVGTLGYIPPEYGQGWVATLRGDIYSFGVVLLELVTGQRPIPVSFVSKELVQWVWEMRAKGKQIEVLDPALQGTGYEEQMLRVLEAACQCVNRNPSMRPTIQEVVSCLDSIDDNLRIQNSVNIE
nr:unnamed protein product [Digitaria exilis]